MHNDKELSEVRENLCFRVEMDWPHWLGWLLVLVFTSPLAGESQGGRCSYTATNKTLLCSNLTRLHLLTGTEEDLANLNNLQIVDSKVWL